MKSLVAIILFLLFAVTYSEDTNFIKQTGITGKMNPNINPNQVPAAHTQRSSGRITHLTERNRLSLALFYLPIDGILTYLCSGVLITIKHLLLVDQCFIKFKNDLSRVQIHVRVRYFPTTKFEKYGSSTYHEIGRHERLHVISLASNVTIEENDRVPFTYLSVAPVTSEYKEAEQLEWNSVNKYKKLITSSILIVSIGLMFPKYWIAVISIPPDDSRCMNKFVIKIYPDEKFIYTYRDQSLTEDQANQIGALLFIEENLVGISTGISPNPKRKKSRLNEDWFVRFIQIGDYYPEIEQMIEELDQGDYKILSKPYSNFFYAQNQMYIPPQQYFPSGPSRGPTWPH